MPYLITIGALALIIAIVFKAGRRAGYKAGRLDEREEWSTKIRELDERWHDCRHHRSMYVSYGRLCMARVGIATLWHGG